MGTGFGSLAKYSLDDFVLGGLTGFQKQCRAIVLNRFGQSRAIVLNRFGLALIARIAPDRSDADYVRRTRSTKRLSDNRFTLQDRQ
jgi:hypothetical protein